MLPLTVLTNVPWLTFQCRRAIGAVGEELDHTLIGEAVLHGEGGTFTVEVCVTDDDGGTGCDDVKITVTAPPVEGICGDQNDDSVVDVLHAIIDLQIIVGLIQATNDQKRFSDVIRDGQISVFDVILTLQHIVELAQITECGPTL